MPFDPTAKLKAKKFAEHLTGFAPSIASDPLPARTGDIEKDDAAEHAAVRAELIRADANVEAVSGCEFSATFVFLTKQQRDAFLNHFQSLVISEGGRYVDGVGAAKSLGVSIPDARPTAIRVAKPDRSALAVGIITDYPE